MSRPYKFCPRCTKPLEVHLDTSDGGSKERYRCPDSRCGFVHWDNPVPVVAAIVEHEGQVVLGRNRSWPAGIFALITGFLERNENPAEAVLREVEEELGLKAHTPVLVGHYTFEQLNQLIIAYHVQAEGEVRLGEELIEYRRVDPIKLRPWPAATGLALRDWMLSRGYTPEIRPLSPLQAIHNFLPLGDRFGTGGQPTADQFKLLEAHGYKTVINLALPSSTNALPDEPEIVRGLGLRFEHIPVQFDAPTDQDLKRFFGLLDELGEEKVFVHCAMNMRVSAFMFLYRVLKLGVPVSEAEMVLHRIWTPDSVWQEFIDRTLRSG